MVYTMRSSGQNVIQLDVGRVLFVYIFCYGFCGIIGWSSYAPRLIPTLVSIIQDKHELLMCTH